VITSLDDIRNVRPRQKLPIPWGWENITTDDGPVCVKSPGTIRMPLLEQYFDWSRYEIIGEGDSFGTRDMKSIFQTALRFLGWDNFAKRPTPYIGDITREFLKWNHTNLERSPVKLRYYIIGDDYGMNNGLLLSPHMWRSLIKPELYKLIEQARYFGLSVIMHSDGDVSELLDDFVEIGVSYLHPCQCVGGMPFPNIIGHKGMQFIREEIPLTYQGYTPMEFGNRDQS